MAGSECVSGHEAQMMELLNDTRNVEVVVYRSTYAHEQIGRA